MTDETNPTANEMHAHYIKANDYRTIFAEGCFGGVTPRGLIRSTFYNERAPIPRETKFGIVDGQPQAEEIVDSRSGIVRQLEVDVIMDLGAAISYMNWLRRHVETLRQTMGISDADWQTMNEQGKK